VQWKSAVARGNFEGEVNMKLLEFWSAACSCWAARFPFCNLHYANHRRGSECSPFRSSLTLPPRF